MPESFHPFPRLPLELRLMIWTFVLQPRVPGVHIFGTDYGKDNSNNGYVTPSDDFARPLNRGYGVQQLTAPAPRARPAASTTPEPSWTTNNPSSYLIDGGLWTACKESRAVIEQEYEAKRWRAFTNAELSSFDYRGDYPQEKIRRPSTGYFLNNGSPHYFTVFPNRDLFYFQANGLEWEMISRHGIPSRHPLWGPTHGFREPYHVAIEYNPEWRTNNQSGDIYDFAEVTVASYINIIWFVDYRLKRRTPGSTNRKRAIFEGVDRRFVEVVGCHIGAEHMHDEFETDSGSLEFYEAVEKAATWQENNENNSDLIGSYGRAHFGILACELL